MIILEKCSVMSIKMGERTHINHAVNMAFCRSLRKTAIGTVPGIQFEGCAVTWCYTSVSERDTVFDKLLEKFKWKQ